MARQAFTQAKVCTALRGARAAGMNPCEARISRDGDIVLIFGPDKAENAADRDAEAELDAYEARHGAA